MLLRFLILFFILGMNGFFAAAEVSLVSVRQSRLRELAEQGQAGAQSALSLLANPGRLLSVTQVGVTLASLGLGWAGEDFLFDLLNRALASFPLHANQVLLHGLAFGVSFLVISYCHVIIGEVVPKNLAIGKADRIASFAAPGLLLFYRVSQPFVVVIERSSALILKWLGLTPGQHQRGGHTPEELKYIIESSRHEGHLDPSQESAIQHIIELSDLLAREIMTPRHNIVSVSVDADIDVVLSTFAEHKYTRVPVYEDRTELIIGFVHYKDLIRIWDERPFAHDRRRSSKPFRLRRFLRKPLVVPETKPLNDIIADFKQAHTHMALVVDEFGTVTGLITLGDLLQQVFGDIGDEHDVVRPALVSDKVVQLEGATSIRELETHYNVMLPSESGFETLAGFLLFQFGYIPKVGSTIDYGGRRFTITQMDRNRIAKVLMEKLETQVSPDPANEG
jgi:CBS domain containing-hemolysin-like protein